MAKVLICDQVEIEKLALGDAITFDYSPSITREDLLKKIGGYDAIIVRSRTKVDRELIDRAPGLKLIARPGTGLDNVDVEYAKSKGITVVNSPESLVEAVSEHVTLLMLALSRRLVRADESTKAGRWEKNSLMGRELKGKTLGIVGLERREGARWYDAGGCTWGLGLRGLRRSRHGEGEPEHGQRGGEGAAERHASAG